MIITFEFKIPCFPTVLFYQVAKKVLFCIVILFCIKTLLLLVLRSKKKSSIDNSYTQSRDGGPGSVCMVVRVSDPFGFPAEGAGSEHGGIGLLELAQQHFGFAFEYTEHVLVHGFLQGLEQQVSALGESAEQYECLG